MHRLHLEGTGKQSLRKACEQIAGVRALHRKPVSLNTVAPYVEFMGQTVAPPHGWPTIRTPLDCAIFARHVEPAQGAREESPHGRRELQGEGFHRRGGGRHQPPAIYRREPLIHLLSTIEMVLLGAETVQAGSSTFTRWAE